MRTGKCAILTHSYIPQDPRSWRQAKTLAGMGWEVECICLRNRGQEREEMIDGVRVIRLPVRHIQKNMGRYMIEYAAFSFLALLTLARRSGGRGYDVVQVNTPPDFLVFAALVPRARGARIVLDMQQPSPEFFAAHFRKSLRSVSTRAVILVERLSARLAHRLLVSGNAAREAYRKRGIPDSKMTVIPNCCEEDLFRPGRNGAAHRGTDSIRLLFHGTLIERYGIDTAIRAVALLRESRKEVRFDIYGEGEFAGELTELIRSLDLEESVQLHGYIARADVPEKIAEADIGLIPYKRDIFIDMMLPNKLFEYVATKKPFVVSPIRAILDHFPPPLLNTFDSESPWELAREIIRVVENGDESARRAEELFSLFEKECWGRVRRSYVDAIEGRSN